MTLADFRDFSDLNTCILPQNTKRDIQNSGQIVKLRAIRLSNTYDISKQSHQ